MFPFSLVDEVVVLRPTGSLDISNAPAFKEWVSDTFLDSGKKYIAVDLSEVEAMDSYALGVLISLYKHLRMREGMLFLISPRDAMKRIIEMTSLDRIIPVVGSVNDILERIK